MSSSVQAAYSSNHHQFHTIHSHHNDAQYQELSKMTPGPNSEDDLITIHPLRQPSVTTSRQVSRDSDIAIGDNYKLEGTKTPKDFDGMEIPNDAFQASVITPRESCDRIQDTAVIPPSNNAAAPLTSSSAKISMIPGAGNSNRNDENNTDDVVREVTCASTTSSSTDTSSPNLPPSFHSGAIRDNSDVVGTHSGSSTIADPITSSPSTTSTPAIATHNIEGQSPASTIAKAGTKRKMSPIANGSFSPNVESSQSSTPMSRRDSLPMGLRNKKMKATDCLLFAATLLEQDAAEALVAASTSSSATNNNRSSLSNGSLPATSPAAPSFVPHATASQPVRRTKPLKKMVCEKIERSLQEVALQQKQQQQQEQQQESQQEQQEKQLEDGDCENTPKDADVLCGRGGKVNKHPGNIVYRKVVEYNKSYYQSVHKKHRILVSQSIVKAILNYGGRFMGQKGKEWTPICFKRAVQKTSQALRERSNSLDVVLKGVIGDFNHGKQQLVIEPAETKSELQNEKQFRS